MGRAILVDEYHEFLGFKNEVQSLLPLAEIGATFKQYTKLLNARRDVIEHKMTALLELLASWVMSDCSHILLGDCSEFLRVQEYSKEKAKQAFEKRGWTIDEHNHLVPPGRK